MGAGNVIHRENKFRLSVTKATGYGMDKPGFDVRQGQGHFSSLPYPGEPG